MKFKGLKSKQYANKWDEAYPVGNGTMGCLVFGNPLNEKIVTSHEDLFLPLPVNNDVRPFKTAGCINEVRELLFAGKYYEATERFLREAEKDGYPYDTCIWTNPFETATEIYIDIPDVKEVSDYVSRLDFTSGELVTSFLADGNKVQRNCFASRTRNVFVMKIEADKPITLNISTGTNENIHDVSEVTHTVDANTITTKSVHSEEESGYVSVLKVLSENAPDTSIETINNGICVKNGKEVIVLYTLSPWKKSFEAARVKAVREIESIAPVYDVLFKEHTTIHRELFERVKVTLSECGEELLNEDLLKQSRDGELTSELLERMSDYGRYLDIVSFGKLPPNLQGVFNGDANPPWSSDYTLDENIQMMMWQVLPGALPEFARVYFDWLEMYNDDFKENAKVVYGVDGFLCASRVSTTDGIHRHFAHAFPMAFWTAGSGWLSSVYEDFYEFTGDKNILSRGVKYWKEVVKFYEGFLVKDKKGRFVFAPSYSPENTPLGHNSPTAVNATMDVAIAKEVYTNLINACETLGTEEDNIDRWKEELAVFPDYAINEDGAIKEWIPEELKDDYHHRHSSHLYPVFPGHEAMDAGNEDLKSACHRAAELRLIDGVDAISGWGLAHLANISARLNDADLWFSALNRLIRVFTLKNLFTTHNEYSLFQMDANTGITAAVFEAFMYSDKERVFLFPIVCDKFSHMCVEGLRGRGCMHVIRLEKNGDYIIAHLENQGKNTMRIVCPDGFSFENGNREASISPGGVVVLKAVKRG